MTSGSEREGRPGLGLVLGFIAYAQRAGMLAAFMVGPGLEDDVDPEGGARLGELPGETMRAESAAEQDVRKCLVEALQVALETWLEGAVREGGSRSNGLLGGVGVVGSVAIDGSIEVLPEFGQGGRALAFGMTGGRGHGEATSLAEVFNALECLGPCEGTRTMWQRVIQVRSRCCIACFPDALALCRVPQREEGERGECACRCELPARERGRRRAKGFSARIWMRAIFVLEYVPGTRDCPATQSKQPMGRASAGGFAHSCARPRRAYGDDNVARPSSCWASQRPLRCRNGWCLAQAPACCSQERRLWARHWCFECASMAGRRRGLLVLDA